MLADYHTHTYYSDDSECPMEEMVRKAVAIGLDEIAHGFFAGKPHRFAQRQA